MKYYKEILEVIFFARGGQGAKTAAEILAQSAVSEGKFVQTFPSFGPERSGAPTRTYLRVSDNEIRMHEPVIDPDVVVVLDDTLLESQNVSEHLDRNEAVIINTKKDDYEIREEMSKLGKNFAGKIYTIDANKISMDIVGQPRPNTVILGKFVKVTEIVRLESVISEFRKIFEEKVGREICEKNIMAIEKAYDII